MFNFVSSNQSNEAAMVPNHQNYQQQRAQYQSYAQQSQHSQHSQYQQYPRCQPQHQHQQQQYPQCQSQQQTSVLNMPDLYTKRFDETANSQQLNDACLDSRTKLMIDELVASTEVNGPGDTIPANESRELLHEISRDNTVECSRATAAITPSESTKRKKKSSTEANVDDGTIAKKNRETPQTSIEMKRTDGSGSISIKRETSRSKSDRSSARKSNDGSEARVDDKNVRRNSAKLDEKTDKKIDKKTDKKAATRNSSETTPRKNNEKQARCESIVNQPIVTEEVSLLSENRETRSFHRFCEMVNIYNMLTQNERNHVPAKLYNSLSDAERRFCNDSARELQRKRVHAVYNILCFSLNINSEQTKYNTLQRLCEIGFYDVLQLQQQSTAQQLTEKSMLKYIDMWYDYSKTSDCTWNKITAADVENMLSRNDNVAFKHACRTCVVHFVRFNQCGRLCPKLCNIDAKSVVSKRSEETTTKHVDNETAISSVPPSQDSSMRIAVSLPLKKIFESKASANANVVAITSDDTIDASQKLIASSSLASTNHCSTSRNNTDSESAVDKVITVVEINSDNNDNDEYDDNDSTNSDGESVLDDDVDGVDDDVRRDDTDRQPTSCPKIEILTINSKDAKDDYDSDSSGTDESDDNDDEDILADQKTVHNRCVMIHVCCGKKINFSRAEDVHVAGGDRIGDIYCAYCRRQYRRANRRAKDDSWLGIAEM